MRPTGIVACAFVLVAGLLLSGDLDAGSLEPPGPPAPTMKTIGETEPRTPISSLPFTIAARGSYYLTGDLTGVSGQVGITIAASFVTLDLNGFTLNGVPGSHEGIRALGGTRQIALRNGAIRSWGGVGIVGSSDIHVESLRLENNVGGGMSLGQRGIVRDIIATGNGGNGIITGANSVVSSSIVSNSTSGTGFFLFAPSIATDCIAQNNAGGFYLQAGSRVFHSTARANVVGIAGAEGISIEECTVDLNTDDGIQVGSRSLVRGNLVRGNTNDGIHVFGNENRIEDNEARGNSSGIRVEGVNNLVVKNSASGNSFEYVIVGGNQAGPVSTSPATAGPWANFDQ